MFIYTVKPGDSLFTLSEKFGAGTGDIAEANGLGPYPYLVIGQALLIPSVNYKGEAEPINIPQAADHSAPIRVYSDQDEQKVTCMIPFRYRTGMEGELIPDGDLEVLSKYRNKIPMTVSITCGGESLTDHFLNDMNVQCALINHMLTAIKENGFYGLQIDFKLKPFQLPLTVLFLRNMVKVFRPLKISVSVLIDPMVWHGTCSYAAVGNIADYIIMKTYDLGSRVSPCAVAPLDLLEEIIKNDIAVIPPEKIILGISLSGRDWQLESGGCADRSVGLNQALTIAARYGAQVGFDNKTQSPVFCYTDEQGRKHTIWFEDALSLYYKLQLIGKYGLKGVSMILSDSPFILRLIPFMFSIETIDLNVKP